MGHTSIEMKLRYAHLCQSNLDRAVALLDELRLPLTPPNFEIKAASMLSAGFARLRDRSVGIGAVAGLVRLLSTNFSRSELRRGDADR
jgi:hypothetical protein